VKGKAIEVCNATENNLKNMLGETALLFMLIDQDQLISYCTYAPFDDIQPTDLTPWIGFVYTFEKYRGHHYAGLLIEYVESLAMIMQKKAIYISTNHIGLYEKYGYTFFRIEKDINHHDSRIYRKILTNENKEKLEKGAKRKAEIVKKAKDKVDKVAYCGFSCNHCFLGEWCGGCRSVFNCCSYGTLFEKGKCPNIVCCQEKGIDGCYKCDQLDICTKGFYTPDNDGSKACKAQAIFIRKYGKEKFFQVHDELHKIYDFKKTQEILGNSVQEGLEILENMLKKQE
ncbi:MAG: GNAT family N-acetyltransferase, partial [Traorella sp.]